MRPKLLPGDRRGHRGLGGGGDIADRSELSKASVALRPGNNPRVGRGSGLGVSSGVAVTEEPGSREIAKDARLSDRLISTSGWTFTPNQLGVDSAAR